MYLARKQHSSHVSFARILFAGLAIRSALFCLPQVSRALTERPEISTPASSWKRLREGLYLFEHGLDPYEGDVFQQSPLLLALFSLVSPSDETSTAAVFTLADAIAAWLVWQIADERRSSKGIVLETWIPAATFFLHPFSIAACLGRSPTIIPTLMVLSSVLLASQASAIAAAFNLAIAAQFALYPGLLLPPLLLLATEQSGASRRQHIVGGALSFVISSVALLFLCRYLMDSWSFFRAVRSLLSVSDLTPNVGLSWYLFIEIFDHFRNFFVGAFHLHAVSYVAPLCIKLDKASLFALVVMCGIIATFKSYPSIADVALFHALLSLFPEILPHMRHPLFSATTLLYSTCLLPAFHHLWLYAGSGNANFYYAVTLVWAIANGALVIDALYAHLKRDFLIATTGKEELDKDAVIVQE